MENLELEGFKPFEQELEEACFLGIYFEIESHNSEFGHRNSLKSFPFNNKFVIQKFGKMQASFKVKGFIIGKNVFKIRDNLKKLIEDGVEGELIHPFLGRLIVFCQKVSISEENTKIGKCSIEFEFVESSKNFVIKPKINTQALVENSTKDTKFNALKAFKESYGFVKDLVQETSSKIYDAQMAIGDTVDAVRDVEGFISSVAQIGTDFTYLVYNAKSMIDRVSNIPSFTADLLDGVLESFNRLLNDSEASKVLPQAIITLVLPGMLEISKVDFKSKNDNKSKIENANESKEIFLQYQNVYNKKLQKSETDTNIKEIEKLMQTHVIASACSYAATTATFININEANKIRDNLINKIDQLMNDPTISSDVFKSLYELRINTYNALSSISNEIPSINKYKLKKDQTIFNFCFENFETLNNIDDIVYLNNIKNPLFLNEGDFIEVILDDKVKSK
ncbi:MAG: DNA circularization N-terminal domain-containing protein [Silvanigrellaceae bacterium]|nr:DNA circularization N-terminal domain-containing protein [Silvanigrellaceae bacterium]